MSAHEEKGGRHGPDAYRLPADSPWRKAPQVAFALAALGLAASLYGATTDLTRFGYAWLFAVVAVATLPLGALFFVFTLHLTGGSWGASIRRIAELMLGAMPVVVVAALPLLALAGHMYEWAHFTPHGEEHAASLFEPARALAAEGGHGAAAAGAAHAGPEAVVHHELMTHKAGWLSLPFWQARGLLYLVLWLGLALFYYRNSIRQDEDRALARTRRMRSFAPAAAVLFGLSITFAAFDWVMSLLPTWYSTIFGVYAFAGSAVAIFAVLCLLGVLLYEAGAFQGAVSVEHFHDLGKLLFGFACFWAYIGFSQWMLIWYAGIPEEAAFYHQRRGGGWSEVGALLILGHFVFPFLFLISREVKRRLRLLLVGAAWLLFVHFVDVYWLVLPAASPSHFSLHWLDVAALLAVGGAFFGVFFVLMGRHRLVPVGDPHLSEAIHFVQTQ